MSTFDERGRHHPAVEIFAGVGTIDVFGTPVNDQLAIWTDADTLEGITSLTYNGTALNVPGNITLTGTVDGIDIATDVAANNAKISNATHTGEVTGSAALTVVSSAITNRTTVPVATGDLVLVSDVSDASNLKKVTAQDIADLSGAGAGIFGTEFEIFQSLAQTNTGAASTDKVNATTASKPTGTYRIGFYCDITNSDGTDIWRVQFLIDGIAIHQHTNGGDLYENKPDGNNDWSSESSVHYKTLGVAATMNLQIKFGTNDNTARAANATIEIWRVS